jgi:stage II sporulation protein P
LRKPIFRTLAGLCVVAATVLALTAAAEVGGAGDGARPPSGYALRDVFAREDVAAAIVGFEMNGQLTRQLTIDNGQLTIEDAATATAAPSPAATVTVTAAAAPAQMPLAEPEGDAHAGLFYEGGLEDMDGSGYTPSADGINVRNSTAYEFDLNAMLKTPLDFATDADAPQVLILHSHSSEAYTVADGDEYAESDPYRTEDKTKSIIAVGDALAERLNLRGVNVVHDREIYDYPSYTGSYTRAGEAIERYLEKYPSIKLVIDLHRDAIVAGDGSQFKTLGQVNGESCAQVLLVVGTDEAGLTHPKWRENMTLAVQLEARMNGMYPTLARGVSVSRYRYNQQLTAGSLIVEIGSTGNTLREALTAVKYFADAYASQLTVDS